MHLNWSGLIPIAVGTYVLLGLFRVIQFSKNPEANEQWMRKFGPLLKIICPLVILFGLGELFRLFR